MIVSTEGVREKMPAARPEEFRRRAVELARLREKSISQIAKDLGISESCLRRWMDLADVEENQTGPVAPGETGPGGGRRDPQAGQCFPKCRGLNYVPRQLPTMLV